MEDSRQLSATLKSQEEFTVWCRNYFLVMGPMSVGSISLAVSKMRFELGAAKPNYLSSNAVSVHSSNVHAHLVLALTAVAGCREDPAR